MRAPLLLCSAVLVMSVAGCQDVTAPDPAGDAVRAATVVTDQQTGPSNQCYGEIIAGLASTWPYAHDDRQEFMPPPGAIALWIQLFGSYVGITSVRELQLLFCEVV